MISTKSEVRILDPNSGHSSFLRVTAMAGIPRTLKVGANSVPEDKGSTITTGLFKQTDPYSQYTRPVAPGSVGWHRGYSPSRSPGRRTSASQSESPSRTREDSALPHPH